MSSVLLFCTANFDTEVVEEFVTQSSRVRSAPPNKWILVKSPSEPITGPYLTKAHQFWPEKYPKVVDSLPVKPFKTGFQDASVDIIQDFVHRHGPDDKDIDITHHMFAVLDSRSARDGTALIYQHHSRMPTEELEKDEDAYDEDLLIHEWVEWRVKFLIAAYWCGVYSSAPDYADFEQKRDQYIDKEGVLQMPYVENDEYELPGYPDKEKAPWGPDKGEAEWRFPESPFVDLVEAGIIKTYPVDWE